jgi:Gas vesicle synthesis protein GvpL/GvpF
MTRMPSGLPAATAPEPLQVTNSLWAIAADVPLDQYGPESLPDRLRDMTWVADIAVAHEAVVERVASAKGAAVVPMKLFTMFSSRDRALADLKARGKEIASIVRRIRGCAEWGVRITRRLAKGGRSASPGRRAVPASGTAFLVAKKRARDEAQASALQAVKAADSAFLNLSKLARASHRREAPEGATTPPLVDAAFLVPTSAQARFRAAVRRHASRCRKAGADVILTGPWPAYNFVQAEEARG